MKTKPINVHFYGCIGCSGPVNAIKKINIYEDKSLLRTFGLCVEHETKKLIGTAKRVS